MTLYVREVKICTTYCTTPLQKLKQLLYISDLVFTIILIVFCERRNKNLKKSESEISEVYEVF